MGYTLNAGATRMVGTGFGVKRLFGAFLRSPYKAPLYRQTIKTDVPRYIVSWGLTNIIMSTTKTKIIWRLGKLPGPDEIALLLDKGVLTKDEAREILFSQETEEDRTKKSLQDEIKFLRELVAKLSTNRSVIIETIREVEKPWKKFEWYQPYYNYSSSGNTLHTTTGLTGTASGTSFTANALNAQTGLQGLQNVAQTTTSTMDFQDIKTF